MISIAPSTSSFVILTIRPPPSTTLFPYTTLFRSGRLRRRVGHRVEAEAEAQAETGQAVRREQLDELARPLTQDRKSTRLNLQSRQYLVCRLLLEKKKN